MISQSESIAQTLIGTSEDKYGINYREHLLEQYNIYLQLTDKISDRRSNTNTFFLTLNTGLVSAIGIVNIVFEKTSIVLFMIIGIAACVLCYSWYRIIRSYRDLNSAKFKVIHEIEKHLPLRPYDAEWESLGKGLNKKLYLPFTHIESIVPWIFIVLHIVLVFYGIYLGFMQNK